MDRSSPLLIMVLNVKRIVSIPAPCELLSHDIKWPHQKFKLHQKIASLTAHKTEKKRGSARLAKTINCQGCKTGTIVYDELRIGHYRCSNYPYCHHKPRKCPKCQIGFLYSKESVKLPYYKCSKVFSKCFKFV